MEHCLRYTRSLMGHLCQCKTLPILAHQDAAIIIQNSLFTSTSCIIEQLGRAVRSGRPVVISCWAVYATHPASGMEYGGSGGPIPWVILDGVPEPSQTSQSLGEEGGARIGIWQKHRTKLTMLAENVQCICQAIANLSWCWWVRRTVVARPIHKPVVGVLEVWIQPMADLKIMTLNCQLSLGKRF